MSGWAYGFDSRQPHQLFNPGNPVFARIPGFSIFSPWEYLSIVCPLRPIKIGRRSIFFKCSPHHTKVDVKSHAILLSAPSGGNLAVMLSRGDNKDDKYIHTVLRGDIMAREPIKVTRKGDDGFKVISVRIREGTLEKIDNLAQKSNRSRNELINILLDSSVDDVEIE